VHTDTGVPSDPSHVDRAPHCTAIHQSITTGTFVWNFPVCCSCPLCWASSGLRPPPPCDAPGGPERRGGGIVRRRLPQNGAGVGLSDEVLHPDPRRPQPQHQLRHVPPRRVVACPCIWGGGWYSVLSAGDGDELFGIETDARTRTPPPPSCPVRKHRGGCLVLLHVTICPISPSPFQAAQAPREGGGA